MAVGSGVQLNLLERVVERLPLINSKSWLMRFVGVGDAGDHFAKNAIQFLENPGQKTTLGLFENAVRLVPQPLRPMVAKGLRAINALPGQRYLNSILKSNLVFATVLGLGGALYASYAGFQKSTGGFFDKLASGFQSGVQAIAKTAAGLVTEYGAYVGLPILLGFNPLGATAILTGFIGSWLLKDKVESFVGKSFGGEASEVSTESNAPKPSQNTVASPPPVVFGASTGQAIFQNIQADTQRVLNEARQGPNPWLSPTMTKESAFKFL